MKTLPSTSPSLRRYRRPRRVPRCPRPRRPGRDHRVRPLRDDLWRVGCMPSKLSSPRRRPRTPSRGTRLRRARRRNQADRRPRGDGPRAPRTRPLRRLRGRGVEKMPAADRVGARPASSTATRWPSATKPGLPPGPSSSPRIAARDSRHARSRRRPPRPERRRVLVGNPAPLGRHLRAGRDRPGTRAGSRAPRRARGRARARRTRWAAHRSRREGRRPEGDRRRTLRRSRRARVARGTHLRGCRGGLHAPRRLHPDRVLRLRARCHRPPPERRRPGARIPRAGTRRGGRAPLRPRHDARGRHEYLHAATPRISSRCSTRPRTRGASRRKRARLPQWNRARGAPPSPWSSPTRRSPSWRRFADLARAPSRRARSPSRTRDARASSARTAATSRLRDRATGRFLGPRWPGRRPSTSGTCSRGRLRTE